MPRLETSGMHTCAVASVCLLNSIKSEKASIKKREENFDQWCDEDLSEFVDEFYDDELVTHTQEFGCTPNFGSFEELMFHVVNHGGMEAKVLLATLSQTQYYACDKFWHKRLKKWGFKLTKRFKNRNGEPNFFYMRIPKQMTIKLDGAQR